MKTTTKLLNMLTMQGESVEIRCWRFLGALVLLIALQPLFRVGSGWLGRAVLTFLFTFVLAMGVMAIADNRRCFVRGAALGALAFVALVLQLFREKVDWWTPALYAIFTLYVTRIFLSFVIRARAKRRARLAAALCAYALIGLMWAMAYTTVWAFSNAFFPNDPESFSFSHEFVKIVDGGGAYWAFVYYSYVTLTTLGYGDISPVSGAAQSLAILESMAGVLYIAVMVASLVGSTDVPSEDANHPSGDE